MDRGRRCQEMTGADRPRSDCGWHDELLALADAVGVSLVAVVDTGEPVPVPDYFAILESQLAVEAPVALQSAVEGIQVPEAAMKLRQGFGRLIRNMTDTGICILMDTRLCRRQYGKTILGSLPVEAREPFVVLTAAIIRAV